MRDAPLIPEQAFDILDNGGIWLRLVLIGGRELVGSVCDRGDIILFLAAIS
jgi:hypothetical protein